MKFGGWWQHVVVVVVGDKQRNRSGWNRPEPDLVREPKSSEIKKRIGPPVLPVPSSCHVFNVGTGPQEIATYGSGFCRFYWFLPVPPVPVLLIPVPTGSKNPQNYRPDPILIGSIRFRFRSTCSASEIISSIYPKFSTPVTIESKAFSKLDATLGLIFSKLSLFCLNPNIKNVGYILS
ncbi:unnamed protein product [Lactuca saligna]|uniref:Uncharacterized protein n=1 Tax=Lactuca saligna TaxID=75948 RepID=A0AA35YW90_LACSI|nr:unnamed protein product [Lactuca saligna]